MKKSFFVMVMFFLKPKIIYYPINNKKDLLIIKKLLTLVGTKSLTNQPIIIPAIVADRREAIDPPIKALIPNSDSVFLCPGAREPIPPI